jgi:hypothetical protein
MYKVLITLAIVFVISSFTSTIHAQRRSQEPTLASPKLSLTLEKRYIIKEILKDMKIEQEPAKVLTVGDRIPDNIRLYPIPNDVAQRVPQIKTHRFFIAGRKIVSVDPGDNKIAEIIGLGSD